MFSVVVPTYERPAGLERCLRGLAALDPPDGGFEVVVVDDGGSAALEPVVSGFRDALDLTLLRRPHAGPAAARNAGADRATRPYLAFLDDDCTPDPGWLRALQRRLDATPDCAVGGRIRNALPDDLYASASQLLLDWFLEAHRSEPGGPSFFPSSNAVFPRGRFLGIGGFDPSFRQPAGEDRDLCDRWRRAGYGMAYAPDAVVDHAHALSLGSFWRQQFAYGRGAFSHRAARARREGMPITLEPLCFYLRLMQRPPGGRPARRWRLWSALILAQMANATGFAWQGLLRIGRAREPAAHGSDLAEICATVRSGAEDFPPERD